MDETTKNAEYCSVSELAQSLKRTVEQAYGHVRVRGELGRVTVAKSGHSYLDLKDDKALINAIIWKGVRSGLGIEPEEGMEVICEGRLSTYPGRSNYQLIIERMELAGAGALMALFEKRRQGLAAEGLFDESRKRRLPFLPATVGVVTSPTGAVIRDILHRISDRFACHVVVWPTLVQGPHAAEQVAAAITGLNEQQGFARPDVLIVARGGGALEDLWCFNEEVVVRAAAASEIPLVSAIGHETDWTLLDYVADLRAPTPTGAAEMVVPVRRLLQEQLTENDLRLQRGMSRQLNDKQTGLRTVPLPRWESVLASPRQRLDITLARLPRWEIVLANSRQKLDMTLTRLPPVKSVLALKHQKLAAIRLPPQILHHQLQSVHKNLQDVSAQLGQVLRHRLDRQHQKFLRLSGLLQAYSYEQVLARGFVLVSDEAGAVIHTKAQLNIGDRVKLDFSDGTHRALIMDDRKKIVKKPVEKRDGNRQDELF